MNVQWFGDKRDLVKWSVLLHLAKTYRISVIVQICFRTQYTWPKISLDGNPPDIGIPENVIHHFRSLCSVERMSRDVSIKVFCQPFTNRNSYREEALGFMARFESQSRIVLLDPDTGLVPPSGHADMSHVTEKEAQAFWDALKRNDILVLYQHRNRTGAQWEKVKRKQFANAILVNLPDVHVARSEGIARDVAFYYVHKV